MRKTIILTLLTAASASGMPKLDALSLIESANNDSAVGKAGEVSRFQIKPHVWRHYSANPNYRNSSLARVVADRFLGDLEADFRRRSRREPTDFDRYVLWNAGPNYYSRIGFSKARVGRTIRERAERYANLCQVPVHVAPRSTKIPSMNPAVPPVLHPTIGRQVANFWIEPRNAHVEIPAFALQPTRLATPSPTAKPATPVQGILALGGLGVE